jgi:thioredoxin-like negative regulator of GroEL
VEELQKEMPGEFVFKDVDITRDTAAMTKYNVQATPTVAVVSPSGAVVSNVAGIPVKAQLRGVIESASQ